MKSFFKDLGVIVVAVAAGLFFASVVHARGLEHGQPVIKIWSGGNSYGPYRAYDRHGQKWQYVRPRHPRTRVIYVVSPPEPRTVFVPVAAPVSVATETGNYCREYNSTAVIDGRQVPIYGTVCRQPDGSWKAVD